jgi:hypothetical protein
VAFAIDGDIARSMAGETQQSGIVGKVQFHDGSQKWSRRCLKWRLDGCFRPQDGLKSSRITGFHRNF